jgi:hypothetical protein
MDADLRVRARATVIPRGDVCACGHVKNHGHVDERGACDGPCCSTKREAA